MCVVCGIATPRVKMALHAVCPQLTVAMSRDAMPAADALDYYLPAPHELQAAILPIVTLHPHYDARQLRAIVKGASETPQGNGV